MPTSPRSKPVTSAPYAKASRTPAGTNARAVVRAIARETSRRVARTYSSRRQRRRQQRQCGRLERRDVVVPRDPAHGVVAAGEERRARQRQHHADRPEARRPARVEGEGRAAGDDQGRADEQHRAKRLVEQRHREQDGAEGRGPDEDRRARRACVADGEDEEELGEARDEEPDGRERQQRGEIQPLGDQGRHCEARRDDERGRRDHDAAEGEIAPAEQPGADGDRHGAEQHARQQAQQDGVHAALVLPPGAHSMLLAREKQASRGRRESRYAGISGRLRTLRGAASQPPRARVSSGREHYSPSVPVRWLMTSIIARARRA